MRFVLFLAIAIIAISAQANESRFIVNKTEGEADIQMSYRRLHSNYDRGNSFTNLIGLDYQRALPQFAEMNVGLGFAQRDADTKLIGGRESTRSTALGFADVTGSLRIAEVEDEFTWYYGGVASISPGAARDSRLAYANTRREEGNILSGYQTIGGTIGVQSYVDKLALGSEFELRAYSTRSVADGYYNDEAIGPRFEERFVPAVSGFIEFPIVKDLALGFDASIMRADPKLDQLLLGGPGNHLSGKLYSEWKVDRETAALMELGTTSKVIPFRENQTEVTLGIRKAL